MSKCSNCPHGQDGCGCKDELCRMFIEAHETYQNEVVKHGKLLHRFAEDFVNDHYFTDETTASGKNTHRKDYCILKEILEERPDLVENYLAKPGFDVSDFHAMMHDFDTVAPGASAINMTGTSSDSRKVPVHNFGSNFNEEQITLLSNAANEAHIFAYEVTEAEMKALFNVTLKTPLKAHNNRRVALLFGTLAHYNLINYDWQAVIEENGLIISSASENPLTADSLSSALNGASDTTATFKTIKKYVEDVVRLQ